MTTKATYRFKDKFNDILIHKIYENHLQGAAAILHVLYHSKPSGVNQIASLMHREFMDTDIISNREAYADDQYRYDLEETSSDINIKVYKKESYNNKTEWVVVDSGNLSGFIKRHYQA